MVSLRDAIVARMSPATRARTALAACRWLSAPDDANGRAPYFEDCGCPVLMVERSTSAQLLDIGRATVELVALPELGTVWLGGPSWPMAGDSYLSAVRQFQTEHAGCANNCGPRRSHLVGIRVEHIDVSDPITGLVRRSTSTNTWPPHRIRSFRTAWTSVPI